MWCRTFGDFMSNSAIMISLPSNLLLPSSGKLENPAAPSYLPKKVVTKKSPVADIVKQLTTPPSQTPASAAGAMMPSVSVKLSYTMKDEKLVRKGTQTFNMNVRQAMSQSTVCGGFIGIAEYPKEVREQVVTVVPGGDWAKAYLSLPRIISDDDINIQEVTLTAGLNDGKKNYDQQVATWTPEEGWTGLGDVGHDLAHSHTECGGFGARFVQPVDEFCSVQIQINEQCCNATCHLSRLLSHSLDAFSRFRLEPP